MKTVPKSELIGKFEAPEGSIDMIYGHIGNGKTTHGVRVMLQALEQGIPVYSNLNLDLDSFSFDDRRKLRFTLGNLLLFKKRYYEFEKSNFHYIDEKDFETKEKLIEYLLTLTDCLIVWDEGQWLLDSYSGTKFAIDLRLWLLHTRHFNRRIVIITQRPTAVHVTARGNIARFYKCQIILRWPFMIMRVLEFQDMAGETVDETAKPTGRQIFILNKKIFRAFNSHYLRGGVPVSQEVFVKAYDLNFGERLSLFVNNLMDKIWPK
jgi:hypothetical protein